MRVRGRRLVCAAAIVGFFMVLVLRNSENKRPVLTSSSIINNENDNLDSKSLRNIEETKRPNSVMGGNREEYRTIDTLLFFVGYPRSRHTLLASLFDRHPHMIVANENNTFWRLVYGEQIARNKMFDDLVRDSKTFMKGGKGMVMEGNIQNTSHFGFFMEGYWQGTYDKYIKVIGDTTAWYTSLLFRDNPREKITSTIDEIEEKYGVTVKFLHIIRNPFDIVSTITLRQTKLGDRFGDHAAKVDDPRVLEISMRRFFRWAEGSAIARELLGDKLLDIDGLKLVQKPIETMAEICEFIGITCSADYLQKCAEVVDPNPSITRNYVVWGKEHLNQMYAEIEQYPFLSFYTYED